MKIILRGGLIFVLLLGFISWSNNNLSLNENRIIEPLLNESEISISNQDFYFTFEDKTVKIGSYKGKEFVFAKNLVEKKLKDDDGYTITIEEMDLLETNDPIFKYLVVRGVSNEKISEKDGYKTYTIAFPITSLDKEGKSGTTSRGGCPKETHTCTSSSKKECSYCGFKRDGNGCIYGCDCLDYFNDCNHSVTSIQVNASLVAMF